MSSLSWDVPSSSTNPSVDDDDPAEGNGRGRAEGLPDDHDGSAADDLVEREQAEREEIEALERELLEQLERGQGGTPDRDQLEEREREQLEALEQEQLAQEREEREQFEQIQAMEREEREEREQLEALEREQLAQLAQLEGSGFELPEESGQSEREQLEELEREQMRQLEELARPQGPPAAAPPSARQSRPRPVERPRPAAPRPAAASAPAPEASSGIDTEALASQFLAAANERQALGEIIRAPAPATELRELSEPARAARAIVEHRHQNLVEANALLVEARRVLAPIAYRGISDRTYLRRKIILGIGEAVSLAIAFSAAFDVAPLEGLLLSGAIALAFVIAGDLGGVLRVAAERSRLSAALEDDVVHLDPRYHHILYHSRQPWLSMIGGATAAVLALATVSVGVLRAANQGSVGLAAGLGLLTVSLAIAAGLSSWQHASVGSEIIDHLQREEEAAGRRLKRAASARVLRQPQIMGTVSSYEPPEMASAASDLEWPPRASATWPPPDLDREAPTAELRTRRPRRVGRGAREKPAKRERASGSLVGAAAARGAVFLATLPGKLRRSEDDGPAAPRKESRRESKRETKIEDMSVVGDGPGALGESAGPISTVAFRPPIQAPKKFG